MCAVKVQSQLNTAQRTHDFKRSGNYAHRKVLRVPLSLVNINLFDWSSIDPHIKKWQHLISAKEWALFTCFKVFEFWQVFFSAICTWNKQLTNGLKKKNVPSSSLKTPHLIGPNYFAESHENPCGKKSEQLPYIFFNLWEILVSWHMKEWWHGKHEC